MSINGIVAGPTLGLFTLGMLCPWVSSRSAGVGFLSGFGTGIMLWANIPIMLLFGAYAMTKYHDYMRRLDNGDLKPGGKKDGDAS